MARLIWDKIGERKYETGVDRGVLYPVGEDGEYEKGVVWNGLTAVNESPSGAEPSAIYADNTKYLTLIGEEEFGATVEAYTYPDEFSKCNGEVELSKGVTIGQQDRSPFGMTYRTLIGNDVKKNKYGYKIHLVYSATAAPSERSNSTVNDTPEPTTFSWELSTTPVDVPGHKPTAHIIIDSTKVTPEQLKKIEDILYGNETTEAKLPLPEELKEIFEGE